MPEVKCHQLRPPLENMYHPAASRRINIGWLEPLQCAKHLLKIWPNEDLVLLLSGRKTNYSGRFSYIAFNHIEYFTDLEEWHKAFHVGTWFGFWSYEMLGNGPSNQFIQTPKMHMARFGALITFDHAQQRCWLNIEQESSLEESELQILLHGMHNTQITTEAKVSIRSVQSNMSSTQYRQNIEQTISALYKGEFYQANITRKFYGHTLGPVYLTQAFSIFCELSKICPTPYSSFLKFGKLTVLSASPEMFLNIDCSGKVETNPIKGSSPSFADPYKDHQSKNWLRKSQKNFSENLMIVDLMRNDLARGCIPGSIKVPRLYEIASYQNIHHAISTVTGTLGKNIDAINFALNCFPPGSMTGAPKIRVIDWCKEIEVMDRGIYSGCIGWFNGHNNSMNTAVTIRTIILQEDKWEFQAGGGILTKSVPDEELEELFAKVSPLCSALGIPLKGLKAL